MSVQGTIKHVLKKVHISGRKRGVIQFIQGCGHIILHDGEQHNYIIGPIAPHGIARTVTPVLLVEHI
jgi:hypothetical protein